MVITSAIAFLLPAFLVHRLPVAVYGAWVLILNLGAYVGYLDFGVQTAVAKYIAEYQASGDVEGCGRCASTGLVIVSGASLLGMVLTGALAWMVPVLFRTMPATLYRDVRVSLVFVGMSLSLGLAASIFPAIFLGLQRYQVPTMINVVSRAMYAAVLCVAVYRHSSLVGMGAAVAGVNLLTGAIQIGAWKRMAGHVEVRMFPVDRVQLRQMLRYCVVLMVWSMCMLVITGLDVTIVGHYAFREVAYYSIAASPTNFMLTLIGAVLGPLLPAASALSTQRSPEEMGRILLRSTRYATMLLLVSGLPLLVAAYPLLRTWVGPNYALHSSPLLRVLVIANVLRQLMAPYATMVVATARQKVATLTAVTEGVVNLAMSLLLAARYGAMGVAAGTLIGAVASVGMHFGVSMRYTPNLAVSRVELLVKGLLRPLTMALPSLVLLSLWWRSGVPSMGAAMWLAWGMATLLLLWFVGMNAAERGSVETGVRSRMGVR